MAKDKTINSAYSFGNPNHHMKTPENYHIREEFGELVTHPQFNSSNL